MYLIFCKKANLKIQIKVVLCLTNSILMSIKHDLACYQKYNKELTVISTKAMSNSPIWSHEVLTFLLLRQQGWIQVYKKGELHEKK